jgi:hypothetical protein
MGERGDHEQEGTSARLLAVEKKNTPTCKIRMRTHGMFAFIFADAGDGGEACICCQQ